MRKLVLLASLALVPSTALAYETLGAVWANYESGVLYCPRARSYDSSTTQNNFLAAINAAAAEWTSPACSALVVDNGTGTSACPSGETPTEGSSRPWVFWAADWSQIEGVTASVIGVTPWLSSGGVIEEAKIIFNDDDYTWTTGTSGVDTDVQSIATHEFGHFFGLDHYDEFSATKEQECANSASYPAIMCAYYNGGLVRDATADDVAGICYLYPIPGALGSQCSGGGDCNSGVCHPAGYCSKSCGTCPTDYTCDTTLGLCERDVPPPTCGTCGAFACESGALCVAAADGAFCANACSVDADCPLGFYCAALEGGSEVCYPLSYSCDDNGPGQGDSCDPDYVCGLGYVCLDDGSTSGGCFAVCTTDNDCANGETCYDADGFGFCDVALDCAQCGSLQCGADPFCLPVDGDGAMCSPACDANSDCPLGFYCADLDGGDSACYPLSESCLSTGPGPGQACDNGTCRLGSVCLSGDCYKACRRDSECSGGATCKSTGEPGIGYCDGGTACACDSSSACNNGCACDVDCAAVCACDTTTGCEPDCACQPSSECDDGCSAVGPNALGVLLGLAMLARRVRRGRGR